MIRRLLRPSLRLVRRLLHWSRLAAGWIGFLWRGQTPAFAYQSLVWLFCISGGGSNDRLSRLVSRFSPRYRFPAAQGVLGLLSEQDLASITGRLDSDGYYLFPERLPEEMCRRLTSYALDRPAAILAGEGAPPMTDVRVPYKLDRNMPRGVRYDLPMGEVIASPEVQALLCDWSILSVAQSYLRARPIADVMAFWWTTAFNAQPSPAAAQYFHFDMDRIKWLKFFIYLTDVGPDAGPHAFIAGSHRTGGTPQSLLDRGYVRLPDGDVRACFPETRWVEFNAPRGTILAEDTRGLHKGKQVLRGDRLMLQLQFSNSLFGADYPKCRLQNVAESPLSGVASAYPKVLSAFL